MLVVSPMTHAASSAPSQAPLPPSVSGWGSAAGGFGKAEGERGQTVCRSLGGEPHEGENDRGRYIGAVIG